MVKYCCYTFMFMLVGGLFHVQAADEDPSLPLNVTRFTDSKEFKIVNTGDCPIYKLEMWTLPPDSSFIQRMTRNASFEKDLGTLEKNYYTRFPASDLIDGNGKRLDGSYVIGMVKFKGSYCGENLYLTLKVEN